MSSIIYTSWGSLAWLIEEYMEDFLWLYNTAVGTRKLLQEGAAEGLPSPDPVVLTITGATLDEDGRYVIEVTCSTKPLARFFGLAPMTEEEWARSKAWDYAGLEKSLKQYKGVKVRIRFKTAKGDVEDVFIKPPGAIVKRTIVLPAPYNYVEVVTSVVWEVDEGKMAEERREQQVATIALIGTLALPYSQEVAGFLAKLAGMSPSTITYWITVSQLAEVLKKMGYASLAALLATKAKEQIEKMMPAAGAAPAAAPPATTPTPTPPTPSPPPTPAIAKTKTSMTAVAYAVNETLRIEVVLRDENGIPLSGKTIEFRVEGKTVGSATTDTSGTATIEIPKPDTSIKITAEFAGDEKYEGCAAATSYTPPALPLRHLPPVPV